MAVCATISGHLTMFPIIFLTTLHGNYNSSHALALSASLQLISLEKNLDSQWSGLWFQAWSRTQIQDTTTSGNERAAYGRKPTEGIRISRSHFACRGR